MWLTQRDREQGLNGSLDFDGHLLADACSLVPGTVPVILSCGEGSFINVVVWLIVLQLTVVGYYPIIYYIILFVCHLLKILVIICSLDLGHKADNYRKGQKSVLLKLFFFCLFIFNEHQLSFWPRARYVGDRSM